MKRNQRLSTLLALALAFWSAQWTGRSDVLLGTSGERFVGKVVEETADAVVFDSELAGRLTIPRSRILELERTVPAAPSPPAGIARPTPTPSLAATNVVNSNDLDWRPPAVGLGESDWIQLKSGR